MPSTSRCAGKRSLSMGDRGALRNFRNKPPESPRLGRLTGASRAMIERTYSFAGRAVHDRCRGQGRGPTRPACTCPVLSPGASLAAAERTRWSVVRSPRSRDDGPAGVARASACHRSPWPATPSSSAGRRWWRCRARSRRTAGTGPTRRRHRRSSGMPGVAPQTAIENLALVGWVCLEPAQLCVADSFEDHAQQPQGHSGPPQENRAMLETCG